MEFYDYLQNHQIYVFNTLKNAFETNKIAQAYLISGSEGAPIFDCAKYIAKSLICSEQKNGFACEQCIDCIRFDEGNYSDLMIIDGSKQTIKVSDVENLQTFLSSSCLEKKGKKIYIINELENANKESINALLKTLEEPAQNTFALITTKNESKILQTIISRCQLLKLLPLDKELIIKEALAKGINKEDAEILSCICSNSSSMIEYSKNDSYLKCKECLKNVLLSMSHSKEEALFYCEKSIIPQIKSKEDARLFLDLLALSFKDMLHIKYDQPLIVSSLQEEMVKVMDNINNIEKCYLEIMLSRGKIELNVSLGLIMEHVFIYIIKGEKYGR